LLLLFRFLFVHAGVYVIYREKEESENHKERELHSLLSKTEKREI